MSTSVPQERISKNQEIGQLSQSQKEDQAYLNLEKIFNQPQRFAKNKPTQSPTPELKIENPISRVQAAQGTISALHKRGVNSMDRKYLPTQLEEKMQLMSPNEQQQFEKRIRYLFDRSRQYSHQQMEDCLKPINLENITPAEHYQTEQTRHYKALKSQLKERPSPVTRDNCISPGEQIKILRRNQNNTGGTTDDSQKDKQDSQGKKRSLGGASPAYFESTYRPGAKDLPVGDVNFLVSKFVSDHNRKMEMQQTRRLLEITNPDTLKKAVTKDLVPNSTLMQDKLSKYVFKNNYSILKKAHNDDKQHEEENEQDESYWVPDRFNKNGFKYQAHGQVNPFLQHPNKINGLGFSYGMPPPTHKKAAGSYTNITVSPLNEKGNALEKQDFESIYKQNFIDMNDKRELVNTNTLLQNSRVNPTSYATPKMTSSKVNAPFADFYKNPQSVEKANQHRPSSKNRGANNQFLSTLNGVQQSVRPEEILKNIEDNSGFWGGNVMSKRQVAEGPSGTFARKRDNQSIWENMYYKGGVCRYKE